MLTGRKPFAGGEYPALLFKHLNADPPKPSAARQGIPTALDAVVARSMAKNPESRFATAGELAAAAEQALAGSVAGTSLVKDELTAPITRSRPSTATSSRGSPGHTPPPAGRTSAPGHAAYSPAASGQTPPPGYTGHTPPPDRAGYAPPPGHSPASATAAYTPPGYGGHPPSSGGYPPHAGVGYGAAPYSAPPSRGTNGFAIAALIFGIIGGALLGFIFGFVALSQTKRTGQNGRGMAIAGIVLSALWTVGLVLLIVLAAASPPRADPSPRPPRRPRDRRSNRPRRRRPRPRPPPSPPPISRSATA